MVSKTAIREEFAFLAPAPGAGHRRKNLTDANVSIFHVYIGVFLKTSLIMFSKTTIYGGLRRTGASSGLFLHAAFWS